MIAEVTVDESSVPFKAALSSTRFRVGKLDRSEYQPRGPIPIIDQGQQAIAGYTDRADLAYKGPLPVVVFGDHTRIFKYIDQPFVAGADGTKILVPNTSRFDPLFFYFALAALQLPSRGYNRHYALLCGQRIACPPLDEQRRIARILSVIQQSSAASIAVIDGLSRLKTAAFRAHWSWESSWQSVALGDIASMRSGGTPDRTRPDYYGGSVPWVKSGELLDRLINATEETLSLAGLANSSARIFPAGTLLMAMYGATAGRVGILGMDAATNQAVVAIDPAAERVDRQYLFYALQHYREGLLATRFGGAQPNLSQATLRQFRLALPPLEDQSTLVVCLQAIDRSLASSQTVRDAQNLVFQATLDGQMTRSPASR